MIQSVNCDVMSEDQVDAKTFMTFEDLEDVDSRTIVGTSPFSSSDVSLMMLPKQWIQSQMKRTISTTALP